MSTAIRLDERVEQTGASLRPDGRSQAEDHSGEQGARLSQRIRASDFTLRGWLSSLAGGLGRLPLGVGVRPCREAQLQKKAWWLANATVPMWRGGARVDKVSRPRRTERSDSIDETWTRTDMAPLRGRASRGHRLTAKVPHGRWKTMTFLAALRHDRIDVPWFIEGPIDGESFRTYVAKFFCRRSAPAISSSWTISAAT